MSTRGLITLIGAVAAASILTHAALAAGADVVLAMPFTEGDGEETADLSEHGHVGTLQGGPTWEDGKFGNALRFEGQQWVDAGDDASLHLDDSDFTFAVWVNFAVEPPAGNLGGAGFALMAKDVGGGDNLKWIWWYSGEGIDFLNHEPGDHSEWIDSEPWSPEVERWYQVALVRSDDIYTYYIDSEPAGEVQNAPAVAEIPAPLEIGRAEGQFYLNGLLDEILIAKRALDDAEVRAHFDGGLSRLMAVEPRGKLALTWAHMKGGDLR